MDDAQVREFLRRLEAVEYTIARLQESDERKNVRLTTVIKRVDDIEISSGEQLARISIEWSRFDEVLKALRDGDEDQGELLDQLFELGRQRAALENERHELALLELKRLGALIAELQNRTWEETTGIKHLDELKKQARDISLTPPAKPTTGSTAPAKRDTWYVLKLIGAITALVVAFGGVITAVSDCASKIKIETIAK